MAPTVVTIVTKREDSNDSSTEDQFTYYQKEKRLREQLSNMFSVELAICLMIFIPSFVLFPSVYMKAFCSGALLLVLAHFLLLCKLHPESVSWYNFASFGLTAIRCACYISSIINYSFVMIYSRNLISKETVIQTLNENVDAFAFYLAEITCLIISEVKLVNLYKRFIRFMEDFKTENIVQTYNVNDNLLILS